MSCGLPPNILADYGVGCDLSKIESQQKKLSACGKSEQKKYPVPLGSNSVEYSNVENFSDNVPENQDKDVPVTTKIPVIMDVSKLLGNNNQENTKNTSSYVHFPD